MRPDYITCSDLPLGPPDSPQTWNDLILLTSQVRADRLPHITCRLLEVATVKEYRRVLTALPFLYFPLTLRKLGQLLLAR